MTELDPHWQTTTHRCAECGDVHLPPLFTELQKGDTVTIRDVDGVTHSPMVITDLSPNEDGSIAVILESEGLSVSAINRTTE